MSIVGSGDYRFEPVPSWPDLPRYWSLGACSDAAVNSNDEVHVFARGDRPLTIWNTDGTFISSWGEGSFSPQPHGIFIAPDDNVWLVDRDFHIATEHAPGGTLLRTLGEKLAPSPSFVGRPFNMPSGLAIAPNGDMFVSDGYGGHRVHKFSPEGELLLSWGRQGDVPGEFALLHNIGVDRTGRVFICDRENNRIQIFDADGNFLEQWPGLDAPGDVWIRGDIVYVLEQGGGGGVSIRTLGGEAIASWKGTDAGREGMNGAHGICVDSQGCVYVTQIGPSNGVLKFQPV